MALRTAQPTDMTPAGQIVRNYVRAEVERNIVNESTRRIMAAVSQRLEQQRRQQRKTKRRPDTAATAPARNRGSARRVAPVVDTGLRSVNRVLPLGTPAPPRGRIRLP